MDAVVAGRLRRCRDHLLRPRLPVVAPASSSSASATATPARRLAAGRTELTLTQDVAGVPTARRVLLPAVAPAVSPLGRLVEIWDDDPSCCELLEIHCTDRNLQIIWMSPPSKVSGIWCPAPATA